MPAAITVESGILMLFAVAVTTSRSGLLINRPICLLGEVSFSAYVLHFAVLHKLPLILPAIFDRSVEGWGSIVAYATLWLFAVPLTLILSCITYRTIEVPMIDVGHRVIRSMKTGWPRLHGALSTNGPRTVQKPDDDRRIRAVQPTSTS